MDVFNLTDRKVNDVEYFYAARLPTAALPVDDTHIHAAEPRSFGLTLTVSL